MSTRTAGRWARQCMLLPPLTVLPCGSPASTATRRESDTALMRRGCVHATRRKGLGWPSGRGPKARNWGTCEPDVGQMDEGARGQGGSPQLLHFPPTCSSGCGSRLGREERSSLSAHHPQLQVSPDPHLRGLAAARVARDHQRLRRSGPRATARAHTTHSPQPTAHSPQPTAHSPQPTAHSPCSRHSSRRGAHAARPQQCAPPAARHAACAHARGGPARSSQAADGAAHPPRSALSTRQRSHGPAGGGQGGYGPNGLCAHRARKLPGASPARAGWRRGSPLRAT
jgi:hypothetical protein